MKTFTSLLTTLTVAGTAIAFTALTGCQGTAPEQDSEADGEQLGHLSAALFENTCSTATLATSVPLSGTAPTSCGVLQNYVATSSTSYNSNPSSCPYQFLVEVARAGNAPIGSGYYFERSATAGGIIGGFSGQTDCQARNATYAVWSYSGGTWTLVGEEWLKGTWSSGPDVLFPCTWQTYAGSSSGLTSVPSAPTKLRIAAAMWKESGTKGADGSDTFYSVQAGIGAGSYCPPH